MTLRRDGNSRAERRAEVRARRGPLRRWWLEKLDADDRQLVLRVGLLIGGIVVMTVAWLSGSGS